MKKTALIITGLALSIMWGCASTAPSIFYQLHALENTGQQGAAAGRLVLGVGPVELPEYLNRPQIARRLNANKLDFSEFSRWAEPLDRAVLRVLAENLWVLLGAPQIELYPWRPSLPVDYRVRVRIARFDGAVGKAAELRAFWSIYGRDGGPALVSRTAVIAEPCEGRGMERLVRAHNRALEQLSRDIAAELRRLAPGG